MRRRCVTGVGRADDKAAGGKEVKTLLCRTHRTASILTALVGRSAADEAYASALSSALSFIFLDVIP